MNGFTVPSRNDRLVDYAEWGGQPASERVAPIISSPLARLLLQRLTALVLSDARHVKSIARKLFSPKGVPFKQNHTPSLPWEVFSPLVNLFPLRTRLLPAVNDGVSASLGEQ